MEKLNTSKTFQYPTKDETLIIAPIGNEIEYKVKEMIELEEIFKQVEGKWEYDFELLAAKSDKMFARLDVESIFKTHKEHIKLVDVHEGETYINILILTTGLCYELVFNKTNKESYVNSISAAAIERIIKALSVQEQNY